MDILSFMNQFDLHDSGIENIGHEFYEDQLIITINLCNWRQTSFKDDQKKNIVGNLVFSGVKEIEIEPKHFVVDGNDIINVIHKQQIGDLDKIIIVFLTQEPKGFVELSFKAKSVEWDPLEYDN